MNRALPPARLVTAGPGEPLSCGGDLVTLQSAHLADTAALYDACGLPDEGPLPEQTLLCAVTVCRGGAAPEESGPRGSRGARGGDDGRHRPAALLDSGL